jgi:hypothetical protein
VNSEPLYVPARLNLPAAQIRELQREARRSGQLAAFARILAAGGARLEDFMPTRARLRLIRGGKR